MPMLKCLIMRGASLKRDALDKMIIEEAEIIKQLLQDQALTQVLSTLLMI